LENASAKATSIMQTPPATETATRPRRKLWDLKPPFLTMETSSAVKAVGCVSFGNE
jgi:hypothetical protein